MSEKKPIVTVPVPPAMSLLSPAGRVAARIAAKLAKDAEKQS